MKETQLIEHRDLVEAGYLFFDKDQEKKFIDSLNRELLYRTGDKLSVELSPEWEQNIDKKPAEEALKYLLSNAPAGKQTIKVIKKDILTRIIKKRRIILVKGAQK